MNRNENINKKLIHSIIHYDYSGVELALKEGANINSKYLSQELSVLHIALNGVSRDMDKGLRILNLLLEKGADVNQIDGYGRSVLHLTHCYDSKIINLFFKNGANPNVSDNLGRTPLYYNFFKNIELFIKNNADLNIQDCYGNTIMHRVVMDDNLKDVKRNIKFLLDNGAVLKDNEDYLDARHVFMLYHYMCTYGQSGSTDYDEIKRMFNKISDEKFPENINELTGLFKCLINEFGNNYLYTALSKIKRCENLLIGLKHWGDNIEFQEKDCGYIPVRLKDAIMINSIDGIKNIIKDGYDLELADINGDTILTKYINRALIYNMQCILENNINVNHSNKKGMTALMQLVSSRRYYLIDLLLAKGADINKIIFFDNSALGVAAKDINFEMLKYLLNKKANPNIALARVCSLRGLGRWVDEDLCNKKSNSDIGQFVCDYHREKRIKIIKLFIDFGADINTKDKLGRTPLMYAAEDALDNIVDFLIVNGANTDIEDNKGNTAWFYAISNLHLDTAQIIVN